MEEDSSAPAGGGKKGKKKKAVPRSLSASSAVDHAADEKSLSTSDGSVASLAAAAGAGGEQEEDAAAAAAAAAMAADAEAAAATAAAEAAAQAELEERFRVQVRSLLASSCAGYFLALTLYCCRLACTAGSHCHPKTCGRRSPSHSILHPDRSAAAAAPLPLLIWCSKSGRKHMNVPWSCAGRSCKP
jgi:hypothetical protein